MSHREDHTNASGWVSQRTVNLTCLYGGFELRGVMNPGVILSVGGGRAGSRRISLGPLSIARRSFDCPPDHPPTLRMTHWFISHSTGARAVHPLRMTPLAHHPQIARPSLPTPSSHTSRGVR